MFQTLNHRICTFVSCVWCSHAFSMSLLSSICKHTPCTAKLFQVFHPYSVRCQNPVKLVKLLLILSLAHTHTTLHTFQYMTCTDVTANDRFVCLGRVVQLEAADIANVSLVVELRVKLRISNIPTQGFFSLSLF